MEEIGISKKMMEQKERKGGYLKEKIGIKNLTTKETESKGEKEK